MEIMKVTKKEIQKRMRSKRVKNSGPDKTPNSQDQPRKKCMTLVQRINFLILCVKVLNHVHLATTSGSLSPTKYFKKSYILVALKINDYDIRLQTGFKLTSLSL